MSDRIKPHTLSNARAYNGRVVEALTLGNIPHLATDAYPGLSQAYDSDAFATAVMNIQKDLNLSCDGKLGRGTWTALLCEYDAVDTDSNYIVMDGRRIELPHSDEYIMICFDEMKSEEATCNIAPLELHSEGHFSRRKAPISQVIMHWGGLDPKHLHAVMSSPERKVSTHFGIGLLEDMPVVMQYIDLKHKTWHAGWANERSVGIDICQQPSLKWLGHYQKAGYKVARTKNPTPRRDRNIISLEPRIKAATNAFVRDLMQSLNIPFIQPNTHDVVPKTDVQESTYTILGHHHLVSKKWDIACWWDDIFNS